LTETKRGQARRGFRSFAGLSDVLGVFLLIAVVTIGATRLFGDSDPALHVATGRWIAEHHEVPRTDPFSATFAGQPWFAHEWLADLLWYGVHRGGGWAGLLALSAILIATAFHLLYRGLAARGADALLAFFVVLLAAAESSVHWLARPHLLTLLFVVIFASVLEDVTTGRVSRRRLVLLPVLMALWANVHGGFLAGFVVLGAYLGASILPRMRAAAGSLALCVLACAVASLANPYGAALHAHLLGYFARPRAALTRNEEFGSLAPDRAGLGIVLLLAIALAVLILQVVASRRTRRAVRPPSLGAALALLATGAMALTAVRHITLLSIFAAIVIADGATALGWRRLVGLDPVLARTEQRRPGWLFALACVAAAVLGLTGRPAHAGYDSRRFPVDVVQRLQSDPSVAGATVFAPDLWGGYLVAELPHAKVFVDGRSDMYGDAFMNRYADVYEARPGWQTALRDSGVGMAILPRAAPLATALAADPEWRVFEEDAAAVAFRRI